MSCFHTPENYTLQAKWEKCQTAPGTFCLPGKRADHCAKVKLASTAVQTWRFPNLLASTGNSHHSSRLSVTCTPHDRSCTPHDRSCTPHDRLCTPHDRLCTPHDRLCTPHDRLCTPHHRLCTPHHRLWPRAQASVSCPEVQAS